jgi:hypothetical protein
LRHKKSNEGHRNEVVAVNRGQEASDLESSCSLVADVIHSGWNLAPRYGYKESAKAEELVVFWIENRFYNHEVPKRF